VLVPVAAAGMWLITAWDWRLALRRIGQAVSDLPAWALLIGIGVVSAAAQYINILAMRAGEASAMARERGGSLLITTSARTTPAAVDALERALGEGWRKRLPEVFEPAEER